MQIIKSDELLNLFGFDTNIWNRVIGCRVTNKKYGNGKIKYAREGKDGVSIDFKYRNFESTIKVINLSYHPIELFVPDDIYSQIQEYKRRVSNPPLNHSKPGSSETFSDSKNSNTSTSPLFIKGDEVSLKTDQNKLGVVTEIRQIGSEFHYKIFIDNDHSQFYPESLLRPFTIEYQIGGFSEFLKDLAIVKLNNKQNDHLYSLFASRTKFEVYQYKPVIKFLSNPSQRILIADEVGLGKTIEAGIIFLELQARVELNRILIVCPSSLTKKWQDEMKSRFDEEFQIYNVSNIRDQVSRYQKFGNETHFRAIVSLEAIRRSDLANSFENLSLDLLIIDEAHHCRNSGTLSWDIADTLSTNSDAVILLTATPLQTGFEDLFNLLKILSPEDFDNFDVFLLRLEPNAYINQAVSHLSSGQIDHALKSLEKVEQTEFKDYFLGNPYYHELVNTLKSKSLDRELLIKSQTRLLELNTIASFYTRTKKRDISSIAPRKAHVLAVEQTSDESRIYNEVVEIARESYSKGKTFGFAGMMHERQAASCLPAFTKKLHEKERSIGIEETFFEIGSPGQNNFEIEMEQIINNQIPMYKRVTTINNANTHNILKDSKYEVFVKALNQIIVENPLSKVLVFSTFPGTIDYLENRLKLDKINCKAIHGKYKVVERNNIINEFRGNPDIQVLISSDVGAEGLDFQFCNTLFNYDLPWNPMKVEQRIGRIDRFGQKAEIIRIFNMVLKNTIEDRILYRLYERINIFKQAIGDIEEILGDEINKLTDNIFRTMLTEAEELIELNKTLDTIERKKVFAEEFEAKKLEFLGQEAIFETAVNHTISSGRFVSERELYELVSSYILDFDLDSKLRDNGGNDRSYCLTIRDKLESEIRQYIKTSGGNNHVGQSFLIKLNDKKEIPLTFSQDIAFERKYIEFITPKHPLSIIAVNHWKTKQLGKKRISKFCIKTDDQEKGVYYFFLYSLDSSGVNPDTHLVPIVIDPINYIYKPDLSIKLLRLIQVSQIDDLSCNIQNFKDNRGVYEHLASEIIGGFRERKEAEIQRLNDQLINMREQAFKQSTEAKKNRSKQILQKVKDQKIINLHKGRIRNLDLSLKEKLKDLDLRKNVVVSFAQILEGIVEIK